MRIRIRLTIAVVLAGSGLVAAGCEDEASTSLTKADYAAAVSQICTDTSRRLNALGHFSVYEFRTKGDQVVTYWRDALRRIDELTPPDELRDAAERFKHSSGAILRDFEDATSAAKRRDRSRFDAALASAVARDPESDKAAKEIGALGCIGR